MKPIYEQMKFKCSILWIALLILTGCKKETVIEEKQPLKNISFGFETSLEDWLSLGGSGERNTDDDILIQSTYTLVGNNSCKFTVSPTSIPASGGNRAELTFDQNAIQDDISWYEYSFYVPANYQDVILNDENGTVNWQILGQWRQQPVWTDGEDWDSFTGEDAQSPIAVYYNYFSTSDSNYLNILQSPLANSIHGFDSQWNEVSTISIDYKGIPIAIGKINKGEWINLKFNIKWSENNDGYIQVWKNGQELTNGKVFGSNMLNKASHYFKFGLYRNPLIPHTNCIYYDEVKIY